MRLHVGPAPGGLLAIACLGALGAAIGWAAAVQIVTILVAGSASIVSIVVAAAAASITIALRRLFFHAWRTRREAGTARREARRILAGVAAGEVHPDPALVCWCIARAAGCCDENPRRLTARRIARAQADLGVRLPRVWVFDPDASAPYAISRSPLPGVMGNNAPAQAPSPALRLLGAAAVVGLVVGIVMLVRATVAYFAAPPLRMSAIIALYRPGAVCLGVCLGTLIALRAFARLRLAFGLTLVRHGDRWLLRSIRGGAARDVRFGDDGLILLFTPVGGDPLERWWVPNGAIAQPDRARFIGPPPWRPIEIVAWPGSALRVALDRAGGGSEDDPDESDISEDEEAEPAPASPEEPGAPAPTSAIAVRFRLPPTPAPLGRCLSAAAFGILLAASAGAWWLAVRIAPPSETTLWICTGAALAGTLLAGWGVYSAVVRALPRRRALREQSAAAAIELAHIPCPPDRADIPEACRLIAPAHGCSAADMSPLTHERLLSAQAALGAPLPRVWIADARHDGRAAWSADAPIPPTALGNRVRERRTLLDLVADGLAWTVLPAAALVIAAAVLSFKSPPNARPLATFQSLAPTLAIALAAAGAALAILVAALRNSWRLGQCRGRVTLYCGRNPARTAVALDPGAFMLWTRTAAAVTPQPGHVAGTSRLTVVGPAPWTTSTVRIDALEMPVDDDSWRAWTGDARAQRGARPARPEGAFDAVAVNLPPSPQPLVPALIASGTVLGTWTLAYLWYITPGRGHPGPGADAVALIFGTVGYLTLLWCLWSIVLEGLPRRLRLAIERRRARRGLAEHAREAAPDLAALCRTVALAHGCSRSCWRALTYERLAAAQSACSVRFPKVWVASSHPLDPAAECFGARVARTATSKVTLPACWQDKAVRSAIAAMLPVLLLAGVIGAGVMPGITWAISIFALSLVAPIVVTLVIARSVVLLLDHASRHAPYLQARPTASTATPSGAFTLVVGGGRGPVRPLRAAPPESFVLLVESARARDDVTGDTPRIVATRSRVVAPAPWGEVEASEVTLSRSDH